MRRPACCDPFPFLSVCVCVCVFPAQVQAADPLSEQLLEETARDEAISDTLYALGHAFQEMASDSDAATQTAGLSAYLKEVNRLSKQQFRSKVLQEKIQERRGGVGA